MTLGRESHAESQGAQGQIALSKEDPGPLETTRQDESIGRSANRSPKASRERVGRHANKTGQIGQGKVFIQVTIYVLDYLTDP